MIMFSFDMLNTKMVLYEQNVTLRLSLIDSNNAKQNYQKFIGVHSFCNDYTIMLTMQESFSKIISLDLSNELQKEALEQNLSCCNASQHCRTRQRV